MSEILRRDSWRGYTHETWRAYRYNPSFAPAVVFCVLFGLASLFQSVQILNALFQKKATKKRVIWILFPFLVGGCFETISFIARIYLSFDVRDFGAYILQMFLMLLAPVFFAATLYMSLGRLIERTECKHHSIISVRFLTKLFVASDIISFLAQLAGVGIIAGGTPDTGRNIVTGGLIFQLVFLGMFIISIITFHVRITKNPSEFAALTRYLPSGFRNWNSILIALNLCSVLIFIRSIFRLIEYVQGDDGFLMSHEAFLYCYDGVLMILNMIIFMSQHVGKYCVKIGTFKLEKGLQISDVSDTSEDFDIEQFPNYRTDL